MTHSEIWRAIDNMAEKLGKSRSALAKECGLDSTTFNISKRYNKYGKPRWPSSQTLSKLLATTGISDADFFNLIESERNL